MTTQNFSFEPTSNNRNIMTNPSLFNLPKPMTSSASDGNSSQPSVSIESQLSSMTNPSLLKIVQPTTSSATLGKTTQRSVSTESNLSSGTLGWNINLQSTYDRMKIIRSNFVRLDVLARKPDITIHQLRAAIILSTAPNVDLTRDVTEFLEVINQQQIHRTIRQKYKKEKEDNQQIRTQSFNTIYDHTYSLNRENQ